MNTDGVLTEDEFDYWVRAGGHIDDAEEALRAHDAVLRSRLVEETRRADEAERRNLELEAEIPSLRSKAEFFDDAIAERNAAEGVCTKLADALRDLLTRPFPQSAYQSWLRDGNSTAAEMLNNYEERVRAAGAVLAEFAGVGASARSGDNPWSPPTTADPNWQPPVTLIPAPVCPECGSDENGPEHRALADLRLEGFAGHSAHRHRDGGTTRDQVRACGGRDRDASWPPPRDMSSPRLLDLFCGAGGAGMGYHRAGFEVVGVDINPQPRYPFEFHQADAMEFPLDGFDAVHASPPCQGYSRLRHLPWLKDREYPMLILPTRERLTAASVPFVIENVMDAPLDPSFVLCGLSLGLPLSRHRRFESNLLMLAPPCPGHTTIQPGAATLGKRYRHSAGVTGVVKEISRDSVAGHFAGIDRARAAMGIDWMKRDELAQAIPPAFTEWIGEQLLAYIGASA